MSAAGASGYRPGLEGVIAGESAICVVDPGEQTGGLLYRGYDVHQLAMRCGFEEIIWLLLRGELPTPAEAERMRGELAAEARLPAAVTAMLRLSPKGAHSIDVLRTGVSMLGEFDPEVNDPSHDANLRKAVRIIALIPSIVANAWRINRGRETIETDGKLAYAERLLFELNEEMPEPWLVAAVNIVLALYAEHEFNASTFSARVTASTMADIYAAITSAVGTLKGPLHGGANEAAMAMLREIGAADRAEAWVKRKFSAKERIMGFGHRVYKHGDSRVPAMRDLARSLAERFGETELIEVCQRLESIMEREKNLYANLDLYAAPVLHLMGIPAELDISIFACARSSGWCAHVVEQHDHNRLIRPRCLYTGPPRREMPDGK
ncbi:MAG TPA: citrate/2-methylcitrate synthase [Tepidisphaeraceae bacterium]|jgi:2-methylcitrate synthase/citrate synthase II|nr:citrate/2-methylcitrate synthase [Tepidisphaeraceae bacterium]